MALADGGGAASGVAGEQHLMQTRAREDQPVGRQDRRGGRGRVGGVVAGDVASADSGDPTVRSPLDGLRATERVDPKHELIAGVPHLPDRRVRAPPEAHDPPGPVPLPGEPVPLGALGGGDLAGGGPAQPDLPPDGVGQRGDPPAPALTTPAPACGGARGRVAVRRGGRRRGARAGRAPGGLPERIQPQPLMRDRVAVDGPDPAGQPPGGVKLARLGQAVRSGDPGDEPSARQPGQGSPGAAVVHGGEQGGVWVERQPCGIAGRVGDLRRPSQAVPRHGHRAVVPRESPDAAIGVRRALRHAVWAGDPNAIAGIRQRRPGRLGAGIPAHHALPRRSARAVQRRLVHPPQRSRRPHGEPAHHLAAARVAVPSVGLVTPHRLPPTCLVRPQGRPEHRIHLPRRPMSVVGPLDEPQTACVGLGFPREPGLVGRPRRAGRRLGGQRRRQVAGRGPGGERVGLAAQLRAPQPVGELGRRRAIGQTHGRHHVAPPGPLGPDAAGVHLLHRPAQAIPSCRARREPRRRLARDPPPRVVGSEGRKGAPATSGHAAEAVLLAFLGDPPLPAPVHGDDGAPGRLGRPIPAPRLLHLPHVARRQPPDDGQRATQGVVGERLVDTERGRRPSAGPS